MGSPTFLLFYLLFYLNVILHPFAFYLIFLSVCFYLLNKYREKNNLVSLLHCSYSRMYNIVFSSCRKKITRNIFFLFEYLCVLGTRKKGKKQHNVTKESKYKKKKIIRKINRECPDTCNVIVEQKKKDINSAYNGIINVIISLGSFSMHYILHQLTYFFPYFIYIKTVQFDSIEYINIQEEKKNMKSNKKCKRHHYNGICASLSL